ncbi:aminotransferase class III-fold pyridoxal phosphate-dependent enzyme [Methanosarcina barkeri]|uniref:aminotransferase class III-fold pyridoxal phosphate-dependent enzyme n=1 Tax=Methanosarcina barkeri TaxID=2208 RepID=UPI000A7A2046|nr:aminotransferase class III-fold pyridoxal phosphate-dependent enzyme [Methanosarcina barkeri]
MDSAKGSVIRDVDGREYIDLVAGIAVMNAGYSNSEVKAAILSQLEKNDSLRIWRFLCRTSCKACKKS